MESRDKEISLLNDAHLNNDEAAAEEDAASFPAAKQNRFVRFVRSGFFNTTINCTLVLFLLSLTVYILSRFLPEFAEFWTKYPAQAVRFVLAKITGWIPFSLAEAVLISLPILAIGYIVLSCVSTAEDESRECFYKWVRPLVCFILIIASIFFCAFGPAYGRKKLADNLLLDRKDVSTDELYETGVAVINEAKALTDSVYFDVSGASVMPYDYGTLVEKVNDAFEKYAEEAEYISHFSSNPKAIALSKPMTYTHISGVYTFMTGESNVNTNYPDFLVPFTMAHEMAHQRGIAREDEANFVAFLVCISSDDEYIRYSGYANMTNYILSALSSADRQKYSELFVNVLSREIAKEFVAYSLFFDKYRDSVASTVTDTVNNAFLQSQGQSAGTKSYGLVVDLAVAYYK